MSEIKKSLTRQKTKKTIGSVLKKQTPVKLHGNRTRNEQIEVNNRIDSLVKALPYDKLIFEGGNDGLGSMGGPGLMRLSTVGLRNSNVQGLALDL